MDNSYKKNANIEQRTLLIKYMNKNSILLKRKLTFSFKLKDSVCGMK